MATIVAVPTLSFLFWTVQIEEGQWDFVHAPGPSLLARTRAYLSATFVHFDLGRSTSLDRTPVARVVREGLPADVALLAGSVLVGVGLALVAGTLVATRPRSLAGRATQALTAVGLGTPVYTAGFVVLLLFSPFTGRLPLAFVSGQGDYAPLTEDPVRWLRSLWVPVLLLAVPLAAAGTRIVGAAVREVVHDESVRTARAKGMAERRVLARHVLPLAAAPLASLTGARMGFAVLDVALAEAVFNVPGTFRQARAAVDHLDFPLLQGMVLVTTLLVVAGTLCSDVVLRWLDPRTR